MNFRKIASKLTFGLVALGGLALAACSSQGKFGKSLSHQEYMDTKDGETVIIEGYIQGRRTWYNGAVVYLQDDNGGYFVYNLPCTEEEYKTQLKVGNKIQVKGYKTSWQNEVEILGDQSGKEAEWNLMSGTKTYQAKKLAKLSDGLANQNSFVAYDGLIVSNVYEEGRNVYYDVTDGTDLYTFCVETYMELTPKTSETYSTVKSLTKGDVINVEGFQYVYGTPQLHTTKVVKQNKNIFNKGTGVLSYSEFLAKETGSTVKISGYIMDRQSWWTSNDQGKATFYIADKDGAYFVYNLFCTKEQFDNSLTIGTHVEIEGYKTAWKGEVEIQGDQSGKEATFTVMNDYKFLASATNLTSLLTNKTELAKHNNEKVSFNGMTVVSVTAPTSDGGDIYFDVKYTPENGEAVTYTFCVESYLRDKTTSVYQTVLGLKAGDKVNLTGYLYIYNDPQLHTINCTVVK